MEVARFLAGWTAATLVCVGCTSGPRTGSELAAEAVEDPLDIAAAQPLMTEKAQGDPSSGVVPGPEWIALEDFCREQDTVLARRVVAEENPQYLLQTPAGTLEIRADSRQARWNGVQFWMAYGPKLIGQTPYLHVLDSQKNLVPLLRGQPAGFQGRIIVVDPGHGGKDLGTQNPGRGTHEKDLTLDWAFRVRDLLRARGWTAYLTRTNDTALGLAERVQFCDRVKADLFVSLHFNSSLPATNRVGVETFCLTPAGLPSTLVRFGEEDASKVFPNNAHDTDNFLMAYHLQKSILAKTGAVDRGVRRARFMTVLQGQQRPAILIEGGFVSSPSEVERLLNPEYRQQLAEAVVEGLEPFQAQAEARR